MNGELVLWDGISKNGQYDIFEVHEDEKGVYEQIAEFKGCTKQSIEFSLLV